MDDSFGSRLHAERKRRKLTQEALADLTDVSRRMVVSYESDETPPNYKFLASLLKLGFDLPYLMAGTASIPVVVDAPNSLQSAIDIINSVPLVGEGINYRLATDETELVDSYRRSSEQMKKVILDLLNVSLGKRAA